MDQPHKVYIALGSNKGDRIKHLQDAVDLIFKRIGYVQIISRIYNSQASGFAGDDFLNCCAIVQTTLSAEDTMKSLLDIETELGRIRSQTGAYQSRTIDLDILFFDDLVIDTKLLRVPHLKLRERKFALQPLNDIASAIKHPTLKKSVSELLESCEDPGQIEPFHIWLKNPSKSSYYCELLTLGRLCLKRGLPLIEWPPA